MIVTHLVPGRDIVDVHALPARKMAAQRQIHVFHCGAVVPAADVLDAGAPPDAACACCAESGVVSHSLPTACACLCMPDDHMLEEAVCEWCSECGPGVDG